jgi:hypothetical protein
MASTPSDTYVFSGFKVWAVFDGTKIEDVIGITATFGLNSIPAATLTLAPGINANTNKPASFHTLRASGRPKLREKVQVYLQIKTTDGKKNKMLSSDKMLIFDGYFAGVGYQRANNSVNFTVHLVHWLDDLNCSSMASGNWLPGAPFDLAEGACAYSVGLTGGGAGSEVNMAPNIDPSGDFINTSTVQSDLWMDCLKKVMETVSDWPPPQLRGEGGQKNDAAKGALTKMPGIGSDKYVPLAMDLSGTNTDAAANGVTEAIKKATTESYAYSTFWGKLIGDWASQFFFAVSPAVEFAYPIPFFGGLKWEAGMKIIYADEYNYASFMANCAQILEEVDIFVSSPSQSGVIAKGNPSAPLPESNFNPSGWYPKKNQDRRGMILLKNLPGWLDRYGFNGGYSPGTTGLITATPGDNINPQHGAPPTEPPPEDLSRTKQLISDRFAEHWYKTELLQARYGEMSGKLRFDIAPGSIIKIEPPVHVMRELPDNSINMYATVVQVSYAINSEQAQAGTSFSLAHIRTEAENNDTQVTTCEMCGGGNRPPIYNKAWKGGPLVIAPAGPADFGSEFRGPGGGIRNPGVDNTA